jgi:putative ABC transport system permease protein
MMRVAIKGLLGRKFRAAMTALAIVLGVVMISGTFVLTDTISKAFDQIFVESQAGTSVVVSGKEVVSRSSSGNATVSESLLAKLKNVSGVLAAAGGIEDSAKILGKDGKVVSKIAPAFAYGIDFGQQRFNPLTLVAGHWPSGSGEVAIDKATADDEKFKVGDTVGVTPGGSTRRFRLAAIVKYGSVDSLGGATIAAFDLKTAQELFEKDGQLDTIQVAAKSGVSPEQLVARIEPLLPTSAQVQTASQEASSNADDVSSGLSFLQYFLLAFGGISLFVGAFVIFNTSSITVAQRVRELATLRTLGASRRQVLNSLIIEALIVGIIASVTGLFLGLLLAKALRALLAGVGLDLPATGTVFASRTIVVSLVVGTAVSVLASLFPALRATRVPPISAVQEGATLPRSRLAPVAPYFAGTAVLLAVLLLGLGMFAGGLSIVTRLLVLGVGCLLLFLGVALLSARAVRPLITFLGFPNAKLGGFPGRLAIQNSIRNPGRTAATAGALMIGLALVTFVAVLGQGLRASIKQSVEKQVLADYIVSSTSGNEPFPRAAGEAIGRASGVDVESSVRGDSADVAGSEQTVTGIDPRTITRVYRFKWKSGSDALLAKLGKQGAVISDTLADDEDLRVGSRFRVVTSNNKKLDFQVRGIFESPTLGSLVGAVAIDRARFDTTFPRPKNENTYVNVSGEPTDATTTTLEKKLDAYPDTKLETRKEFISSRQASISVLLALIYVLLAIAIIVSLFGMINTLALSILERTRELGMLRAIGMTRRQVRSMVRHESLLIGAMGAALGMLLGIFLALLVTRALKGEGIVFAVPGFALLVFAIVAFVAAILAAVLPARRASRLNILEALQYE